GREMERGAVPPGLAPDGEAARAAAAWSAARAAGAAAGAAFDQAFAAALPEVQRELWRLAAGERFRQAVLWQNRQAAQTAMVLYLAGGSRAPDGRRNARQRQHELLVASYLQRYCTKNDAIGFFGPVGWGELAVDGEA